MTGVTIASRRVTSCTYADRVPFPDDALAEGEELVLHLRPHARVAVGPSLVLLPALAVIILTWVMLPSDTGGHLAFGVAALLMLYYGIRYGAVPLVTWRCTHYVFTDERIMLQDGVIARERRDLPLNRINDHSLSQSLMDRFFGSGTLVIDSIGDEAAVLVAVPGAYAVQNTLYGLVEQDRLVRPDDDEEDEEPELPVQRRGLFGRKALGR
jgi:uncharacterized membrane protein YdbT with pleckstrin-like domain